jgi:hypothetical protein
MNMISTGAFQTEMDASNKQQTLAEKFVTVWEKKNAKATRAGGVSLMALSLAACGSSDDDTATDAAADTTTITPVVPVVPVVVVPTAQTLTFTANLDTLAGGDGDDSFNGVYYADGGTGTTAFPGDTAAGGSGTDTLNMSVAGLSTTAQSINAIRTSGIEKIFVTNYDTNADDNEDTTIDTSLMEGYSTLGVQGSNTTDTIFSNVKTIADVEMRNGAGDLTVTYLATSVVGTADVENLTVSNLTAGTFTSNGIETINVHSELAASKVAAIASDAITKMVVTGDANLTVTGAVNFVNGTNNDTINDSTIDASAFTGKLNVTAEAMDQTITGGSGDDTINMVATLNKTDTVDGGAGKDTMTLNAGAITTEFTGVSNIEVVSINDGTAASAVAANKLSAGVTEIIMDANDAAHATGAALAHTVTGHTDEKIILRHTTEDQADANDSDGNAYTITNLSDTAADAITVELQGTGNDTHTATNYFGIDSLSVNNYETVNLISAKNALGTVKDNELDAFSASSATSVVVTGDAEFTTTMTGAKVTSFDASGLAAKLTLTAGAEKATYTAASKDTTFTMGANLANTDTIVGGASAKDTVSATVTGLTAASGNLKISDVENINLTTSGNNVIDATGISGTGVVLSVTDNVQTITNLDLGVTVGLGLTGDAAATASEIDVTAADATGTADTLKVSVNNVAATTSIIDASGIETLDLTATTAAQTITLDLTTFEGDNISLASKTGVTATSAAALGTLHKNTETVTSTYADKVTVSFANATNGTGVTYTGAGTDVQNVTGGAKTDTVTIGSTGAIVHVVSGGAGIDTVNLTATTGLVNVGSIDVENVNIDVVAGTDQTISTSFGTGVDNVTLTGGNSISTFTTGAIVTEVKSVDASAFLGNMVVDVADDAVDSTISLKAGALATDELNYKITGTGTDALTSTGIEILDLNVDATATLNLAGASGVTTIDVDVATTKILTLSNLTGSELIKLSDAATGTGQVVASLADASGLSDSISFELKAANAIADTSLLSTTDIETINVKVSTAELISFANLGAITDASLYSTLNVTGANSLTVTALNADLTKVDASGMSAGGSFVQTGRSSTVAADYKGSDGDDTFIMTLATDVIDAGEKTGDNDTLDINFTGVLGAINVDLSATGDQITSFNGLAESTVQTGFESVDLAGYTAYGAQIIGSTGANTVIGTAQTDSVSLGKGVDIFTVGAGNDVVNMGAGDDSIKMTVTTLKAHSGTTATLDGDAGTADTINVTNAATGVVDADFRGISNIEVLDYNAGDNTVTIGDVFAASSLETIDTSGSAAVFITQDTGNTIGTSSAYLELTGYTVNDASTGFNFLGTDAASNANLSGSGFTTANGLYTDTDGTAASFFTAAGAAFAAGDVGIFVTGGNTFLFAEGANTNTTDDVYIQITGLSLTSVSATHGALVAHIT